MRTERYGIRRLATLALLSAALAAPALGQPGEAVAAAREVLTTHDVLPLRQGVLLRPRGAAELETIELAAGEVAIDGQVVSERELIRRVGAAEAERLLLLADLPGDEISEAFAAAREERDEPGEGIAPPAPLPPPPPLPTDLEEELRRDIEERLREGGDVGEAVRAAERAREEAERIRERVERQVRRSRGRTSDARVVFWAPVHVAADEAVGEVVAIGGPVTIDGEVFGDVVAILGGARVRGEVHGSVVSVGGDLRLGPEAVILGDAVSVGGQLDRPSGAQIRGEIVEVSLWPALLGGLRHGDRFGRGRLDYFDGALGDLFVGIVSLMMLALFGGLAMLLLRAPLERASGRLAREPWKAGLVGAATLVCFIPAMFVVSVLLLISIVGIPLLLLQVFALPAFVLLVVFGYLVAAHRLGMWSAVRFGWRPLGGFVALVVGLMWIHGWSILADLVDVLDGPHDLAGFLSFLLWLFWLVVALMATSAGLGGVLLGWRRRNDGDAVTAAPPPAPPPAPRPAAPVADAAQGEALPAQAPQSGLDEEPLFPDDEPATGEPDWERDERE
ncbi:MAG TPA: hypothetical protein VMT16_02695 [Thermoanaerobaculia bacterium]|nr:hypothetical protein [Thermoanaerobaculia bacterium]